MAGKTNEDLAWSKASAVSPTMLPKRSMAAVAEAQAASCWAAISGEDMPKMVLCLVEDDPNAPEDVVLITP